MATWKILVGTVVLAVLGVTAIFVHNALWNPANRLWLEVRPEKATYVVGEPIVLDLIIHNDKWSAVTLSISGTTQDHVSVALEHDAKDAFEPEQYEMYFSDSTLFIIAPKTSKTKQILLSALYRLNKSGEYRCRVELTTDNNGPVMASNFVIHLTDGPLDGVASSLYDSWRTAQDFWEREMRLRQMCHVRGDAAIEYFRKIVTDGSIPITDREEACWGLARIECAASATELVAFAQNNEIPQDLSNRCKALVVQLHDSTKNEEIKRITKNIAEKYPNA